MKILALETSAKSVSAAVTENGTVLASAYQNRGLTHSVTLMPLVDGMLHAAGLTLDDMGLIAVANGPGSFTGLRIGVSAAKGLAWAKELPCCGVSTLAAMARTSADHHGLVIGAMDARRQQIYHALFRDLEYEKNCRFLCEKGPSIVIFTLGPKGCVGYSPEDGYFEVPSFQIPVVDTVGAGDVFHGAYVVGLLRGLLPKEAARLATGASCIKCTRIGGRAGIPDWDTVQKYLQTGEIDYAEINQRVEFYGRKLQL